LFPYTGRAAVIGVTGAPGVGKSSLVNSMIRILRAKAKTVAVIAVDPTSPFSHGAILGDRVRMEEHYADAGVFIRSMATRGQLGGLGPATLELAMLADAAGFDFVMIETVGVGQDEIEVGDSADVTIVVLAPGFGDDVQALKAGVMEIADIFAINKADLSGAEKLEQELRMMQSLGAKTSQEDEVPICQVVAIENRGVEDLLTTILQVHSKAGRSALQADVWERRIQTQLRERLVLEIPQSAIRECALAVAERRTDPFTALDSLSALLRQ
jgi:LAO/AO transport system kinase